MLFGLLRAAPFVSSPIDLFTAVKPHHKELFREHNLGPDVLMKLVGNVDKN